MALGPGRSSGVVRDVASTTAQRGFPSQRASGIGGTTLGPAGIRGIQFWLDASDTSTITSSSGSVSQWNDISGNSFHASQSTSANQPTTGSITQNGLNVISWDGSNDVLTSSAKTNIFPMTMWMVANVTTLAATRGLLSCGAVGAIDSFVTTGGSINVDVTGERTIGNSGNATVTANVPFVWLFTFGRDGRWVHRVNGAQIATNTTTSYGVGTAQDTRVGQRVESVHSLLGWIAECGKFNYALSLTECLRLEAYLNAKWAVY